MYARCLKMCKLPEDKALKISCHCNRAICYQQQSDFSLVIAECNEALELDPCNPKVRFAYALLQCFSSVTCVRRGWDVYTGDTREALVPAITTN